MSQETIFKEKTSNRVMEIFEGFENILSVSLIL